MADAFGYVWIDNDLTTLTTEAEGPKRITQAELQNYIGLPIEFVGLSSQTPATLEANYYGLVIYVSTSDKIQIKFNWADTRFQKNRQVKLRWQAELGDPISTSTFQDNFSTWSMTQNRIILIEINKEVIGKEFYKWPDAKDIPIFSRINSYSAGDNKVPTNASTNVYGDMYSVPVGNFGIKGKQSEWLSFPNGSYVGINRDQTNSLRFIYPNDTYGDSSAKVLPIYKNWRTGYWPRWHLYDSSFDFYVNHLDTDVINYGEQQDDTNPNIEWIDDETVRLGTKTILVPKGTKIWCFRRSGTGTPSITKAVNVNWDNAYLIDNPFGISKQTDPCIWARTRRSWFFGWTEFDAALHIISHNNEGSHFKIKLPIKLDWWCSSREYESSTWVEVTDLIPDFNLSHGIRKLIQKVGAGNSYTPDGCGGETGRQTIKKLAPSINTVEYGADDNKTDTELRVNLSSPFQYSYYYDGYNLMLCNGREGGLLTNRVTCTYGGTDNAADQSREVSAYLYMSALAGIGVVAPGNYIMSPITTGCKRGSDYDIPSRTIPDRSLAFGHKLTRKWPLYWALASDGTGHKAAADFEFEIISYDEDRYAYAIIIEYPEPIWEVQQLISYTVQNWANSNSASFSSYFYGTDTVQPSLWNIKQIKTNNVCFDAGPISSTSTGSSTVVNGVGVLGFTCNRSGNNPKTLQEYCTHAYYTTAEAQSSPLYELYVNSSGAVCCDITNRASVARTFYYYSESNASVASLTVAAGATSTITRSSGASSGTKLKDSWIQYSANNITYKTPLPWIKRKYGDSSIITLEAGSKDSLKVLRINNNSDTGRSISIYANGSLYSTFVVAAKSSRIVSEKFTTPLAVQVQYYLPENCQYYNWLLHQIPATLQVSKTSTQYNGTWTITHASSTAYSTVTVDIPLGDAIDYEFRYITSSITANCGGWAVSSDEASYSLISGNKLRVTFKMKVVGGGGSAGRITGTYTIYYYKYTVS